MMSQSGRSLALELYLGTSPGQNFKEIPHYRAGRVVSRTVIGDNDFLRGEGLSENAIEYFPQGTRTAMQASTRR